MRKITKRKNKQNKIIIISMLITIICISVGYSAFTTNIILTTKGNIKTFINVNFKTDLLTNTDFNDGLNNWNYNGISTQLTLEIDNTLLHDSNKSMRIYEKAGSNGWNGTSQSLNITIDSTKIYELSAYFYKDETSTYGDLTNKIRMYAQLANDAGAQAVWLKLDNVNDTTNGNCYTGACTAVYNATLPNKTWIYIKAKGKGTDKVGNDDLFSSINKINSFHIDYNAGGSKDSSNVWISEPHFYEIETKQIKKNSKIGTLPTPQKTGYTFVGWYTEEKYINQINENTIINEETNLYAKFIKN